MTRSRVLTNLVAVALASLALFVYAFSELLAGAMFDPTYPLSVTLPESGGLLHNQEVTVSGRVVGRVQGVELEDDVVVAHLAINEGERVPVGSQVVVLRRSPVGEQALDFRPEGDVVAYHEPGDRIDGSDAITPVSVQRLLSLANDVFEPVDEERAGELVGILADVVRGRRDDIRVLISESARFSESIADHGSEYDRFFSASREVSATLARHRRTLARSIGEMADATQVLVDMREEFEALLVEAPPVLAQVGGLVDRSQANLSCTFGHLADINAFLAQPEQQHHLEEALRHNQWFFTAFFIIAPPDQEGRFWNRIHFMLPQNPPAQSYLPAKRPIPDILPGGACTSPFGEGAPSATQADHRITVPEARIVRPAHDRTEPVRSGGAPLGSGTPQGGRPGAGRALPATGGDGLLFLLGIAAVGMGVHTGRRQLRAGGDG